MTRTLYWLCMVPLCWIPSYAQAQSTTNETSEQGVEKPAMAATNLPNDVNDDKVVDVWDVVDIVKYVNGSPRSAFKVEKADIDQNGIVDLEDATLLSKIIVGEELPAGNTNPPGGGSGDDELRGDSVVDPVGPNR
jgi:hypothetical protein